MSIKEAKDGVLVTIFAKPSQPQFRIAFENDEIVVSSTEEPEKGKVNKEIIKESARFFGCQVEIVSGKTSRQKILLLRGASKARVEALIKK